MNTIVKVDFKKASKRKQEKIARIKRNQRIADYLMLILVASIGCLVALSISFAFIILDK